MRAAAVIGLVAGFGLLLQTTLFHALPFGFHPSPDVLVIVCVFLGLHRHTVGAALGAFVLGYIQDAVAGNAAGLNAFGMMVVYVLVFLASGVKALAVLAVSAMSGAFAVEWGPTLWSVLINSAIAAAIAPPLFALLAGARLPEEREAR